MEGAGGQIAAAVADWTIDGDTFQATVVSRDAFRLKQQPLTVEVKRPKGVWTWRVTWLDCDGETLTATIQD